MFEEDGALFITRDGAPGWELSMCSGLGSV